MKKFLFLLLLVAAAASSQQYRYIVVPVRFEVQKEANQYSMNALAKKYFEQLGMTVYMSDEQLPSRSECDRLLMDVVGSSNMFRTALKVVLKDCRNNVVVTSAEGTDRDKNNHMAYNKALRMALKSIDQSQLKVASTPAAEPVAMAGENSETVVLSADFNGAEMLYAQALADGYQLVDTTPKVVLRIYKTSQNDVFSATDGTTSGVLLKDGDKWIYEYFVSGKKERREYRIRF